MRPIITFLLVLLFSISAITPVNSARKRIGRTKSYVVMDAYTGRILFSKNINKHVYPASLTKMMTILITFEHIEKGKLRWKDKVKISRNASRKEPSKIHIRVGECITVKQAIMSLITKSANNVAAALAEKIAGSERRFSNLMNRKAKELKMTASTFYNPSGLPHKWQKTTAHDMAKLTQALILRYGKYYNLFSTRSFRHRGNRYINHNKLLGKCIGLDGVKTGYTRAAGFNLAASARRGHNRIIAVVMGENTSVARNKKVAALVKKGFQKIGLFLRHKGPLKKRPSCIRKS
mgnify:CR=1 FL=1